MPIKPHGPAPYTTASAVLTTLDAWRDRGLGLPVTPDVLARAGVPESIARRTLQSLIHLDLVDEDGQPTDQFKDFRATRGDDEYRIRLQEWLRAVYADVLQYTDPSLDSYDRVTEAFRTYEPAGQRKSMATLLLGLWKYAGLPVAASNPISGDRPRTIRIKPRPKPKASGPKAPEERAPSGDSPAVELDGLPPGLVGLLHQIPRGGGTWTSGRRDSFLAAFNAVLDFTIPVDDDPAPVLGQADDIDPEDDV